MDPNMNMANGTSQHPFHLVEDMLPRAAKNGIRAAYGVIGIVAIVLGICLLVWPGKTLIVATIVLGIYFLISGIVRIVSSIVEMGLPGGWRVLGIIVGILLVIGGIVVLKNVYLSTPILAIMFTLIIGIGWMMEGVMALTESWGTPNSGWAIFYGIISILAGFVLLWMPTASTVWLIIYGGIALVIIGILAVIRAFTFGHSKK